MTGGVSRLSEDASESRASIWARRALSVPVCLILAGLCFAGAPLWILAAVVADLTTGQAGRWPRARAFGFVAVYLASEVAGLVLAALIEAATLGGRLGGPARYQSANAALQRWWSASLFRAGVRLFGMTLEAEGLELASGGPFLLFVRHTSAADSVLAAALVANPHRLLLRYVLKKELLWDPCLDIVGRRLPNAFITRERSGGRAAIGAVRRLATNLDTGSAALVYPEGTRFARTKIAPAVAALESARPDLAEVASRFRHVLPPRLGGALAMLEAAPAADVLLLEHTGLENATTLAEFGNGALVGRTLRVRLRRFLAASIPEQGRDRWLFERWAEMDEWIEVNAGPAASPPVENAATEPGALGPPLATGLLPR